MTQRLTALALALGALGAVRCGPYRVEHSGAGTAESPGPEPYIYAAMVLQDAPARSNAQLALSPPAAPARELAVVEVRASDPAADCASLYHSEAEFMPRLRRVAAEYGGSHGVVLRSAWSDGRWCVPHIVALVAGVYLVP